MNQRPHLSVCDEHDNCVITYIGYECPWCKYELELDDVEKENRELRNELQKYKDKVKQATSALLNA